MVSPYAIAPGTIGISAIHRPSVSRSISNWNRNSRLLTLEDGFLSGMTLRCALAYSNAHYASNCERTQHITGTAKFFINSAKGEPKSPAGDCTQLRNSLHSFHTVISIMKITLSLSPAAQVETECLVAVVLDRAENSDKAKPGRPKNDKPEAFVSASDKAVQQSAADLLSSGDVSGKIFELSWLHKPAGLKGKRLLLVGGGKAKTFSATELRKIAGAAVRALKPRNLRSLAFVVPEQIEAEAAVKAIVEGALIGNFDPDTYKSDRKDQAVESVTVVASGDQKALQQAVEEGRIIGESQNFTRELVNEPSNRMTPTVLAHRAQEMSKEVGLKCEVHGADKIKELKMGAFWGVAQGSDEPPALIVMRYEPAGAPEKPVLGLVGKGITFDTGGISIKPADGMEKMKYDMAGGATMIAT